MGKLRQVVKQYENGYSAVTARLKDVGKDICRKVMKHAELTHQLRVRCYQNAKEIQTKHQQHQTTIGNMGGFPSRWFQRPQPDENGVEIRGPT